MRFMISRGNSLCPIIVCAINQASLARTHVHVHTNLDSSHSNHIIFPDCHILFMPISQIIIKMPTTILSSCLLLMDARLNFFGSPEIFPSAFHSFFFFFFAAIPLVPAVGRCSEALARVRATLLWPRRLGLPRQLAQYPCCCHSARVAQSLITFISAALCMQHTLFSIANIHRGLVTLIYPVSCVSLSHKSTQENMHDTNNSRYYLANCLLFHHFNNKKITYIKLQLSNKDHNLVRNTFMIQGK